MRRLLFAAVRETARAFHGNSSSSEVFGVHWADPSWREVLRLITGRIADRFAGEIIRFLARDAYKPWPQQFGYRPPRNIALAVQCLGEIHSPNAIRREAAELLRVIIELLEHSIGTQDTFARRAAPRGTGPRNSNRGHGLARQRTLPAVVSTSRRILYAGTGLERRRSDCWHTTLRQIKDLHEMLDRLVRDRRRLPETCGCGSRPCGRLGKCPSHTSAPA